MALIDYEGVVADLEAYIEEKDGNSFGERELTDLLRRLRVRHRIHEGLAEKALRLYGSELAESLRRRPNLSTPEGAVEMAESALHRIGSMSREGALNGSLSQ